MPSPNSLLNSLTIHLLGDDGCASQVSDSVYLPFSYSIFLFCFFFCKISRFLSSKILGLNGLNVWVTVQRMNKQIYPTEMSVVTHFAEQFMVIVDQRLSGTSLSN